MSNGDARILPDFMTLNRVERMIENATSMSRQALAADSMDRRRDLNKECGYPESGSLDPVMLSDLVDREPVANRVVSVMPDECWVVQPDVYEDEDENTTTEFEEALDNAANALRGPSWYKGNEGNPLWEYLHRVDTLCGIGWFGILLIGLDDGRQLSDPVDGVDDRGEPTSTQPKERKLLFLRAFDQSLVQVSQWESNPTNPRYGQPTRYQVTLSDPKEPMQTGVGLNQSTVEVHWHRVLHVADNLKSSEVFGVPRCRPVLNPLLDIRKVRGASAEMYWKGGFSGFSLETLPQLGGDVKINAPKLRQQFENYQNSLQRYLILMGMTAKPLAPTVVDPTPQIQAQIDAICIQLKIPVRIFMGSERGELASSQDDQTWNDRLGFRQGNHLTPRLIVPFIDRLIVLSVLPQPKQYYAEWPDLNALSETEKATIAKLRTESIGLYVKDGSEAMIAPLDYYTRIMEFDKKEAEEIIDGVVKHLGDSNPETEDEIMPGHAPAPPVPEPEPGAPVKVKEGEHLVTPEGKPLFSKPGKPTTNDGADYNYANTLPTWKAQ